MKFHFPHNNTFYCVNCPAASQWVHLWHKHEAECEGCAEYYENRDQHEGGVPLFLEDGRDGHPQHAHDHHVIEAHAHILSGVRGEYEATTAGDQGNVVRSHKQ